ncbi:MAG: hypothetical protein OSB58_02930 [Alphaproteobacteria bacterium]|nr:hypothetical protein [Alphaproteobacteria bacterium]
MSHAFVINASKINIDFGRAQSLMNETLAELSAHWVDQNGAILKRSGITDQHQALCDNYCRRHLEYYGEHFAPDLMAEPF